ncbi:uncharacterized protein C2845_PM16G05930 [Panicum miliaceum]|uniref:Uncharacterized protein n=1 Tax=Panicum miliaceum TaxID=4540 RepID=A0A3L6PZ58_PANMI|nr:uncharacterized protein C2845_PM16G05930 [Panicum miliaceum]
MRRRKLVVHSDSDEDEGEGTPTATPASASASASVSVSVARGGGGGSVGRPSPSNPSPLPVPFPSLSQSFDPVVISDDDAEEEVDEIVDSDGHSPIVDAVDVISPPPPPAPAPPPTATPPPPPALSGRLRPVYELLRGLGLRLRPEWLESCAAGIPGFDGLAEAQARRCFEQFLFADMNACGAGVLPEGVGSMHAAVLDGPFVLQVDEIVNMSAPLNVMHMRGQNDA